MFCFQCGQTAGCRACTGKAGVCGKKAGTAELQDRLTLLHLGVKNIRLGPTLPAFISPNVLSYLVEKFGIAPISDPEEDLKAILG